MNVLIKKITRAPIARPRMVCQLIICISLLTPTMWSVSASAQEKPHAVLEQAVQTLLSQFADKRTLFETDKRELFALVDRVVAPLFDFKKISRLVLARNWKPASDIQRDEFGEEFKKLLIGTYATALFRYTGEEKVLFTGSEITERQGRKFAKVYSQVTISNGTPIVVDYALIMNKDGGWKIYNITIAGINMITNYRNTYAAAIGNRGLGDVLSSMKAINAKQYSTP